MKKSFKSSAVSLEEPTNRIEQYLKRIAENVQPIPPIPPQEVHLYKHTMDCINGDGENIEFAFYSDREEEYSFSDLPVEDLVKNSPVFYSIEISGDYKKVTSSIGSFVYIADDGLTVTLIDYEGKLVTVKFSNSDTSVVISDSVYQVL